jgi:hypothetical protein
MNLNNPKTKNIINWFLSLQFIFKPSYWLMNNPYSKELDDIILELLDKYDFKDIDSFKATAKLGNAIIWIENRPYSCITLYETPLEHYRPSRLTILKALKKLDKLEKEEIVKEKEKYFDSVKTIRKNIGLNA